MTPEAQRIAIAEACGWEIHHGGKYCAILNCDNPTLRGKLFDPLADLNAMFEAESILTYEQLHEYTRQIAIVHMQTSNRNDWDYVGFVHIPPNERAEAFLCTLGRWVEDEKKEVMCK